MKFLLKQTAFTFLVLGLIAGGFAVSDAQTVHRKSKQTKIVKQTKQQTNDGVSYEPDAGLLKEMQEKVIISESKKDWASFERQSPIANPSASRSAYIAQFKAEDAPNSLTDVIVVNDTKSGKFYELRGFEFNRPFAGIRWTSDDVLQFEQWVNPRNGGRYAVNLKTGKLVAAGYVRNE